MIPTVEEFTGHKFETRFEEWLYRLSRGGCDGEGGGGGQAGEKKDHRDSTVRSGRPRAAAATLNT